MNAYGLRWHVTYLEFCRLFFTPGSDSRQYIFLGGIRLKTPPPVNMNEMR